MAHDRLVDAANRHARHHDWGAARGGKGRRRDGSATADSLRQPADNWLGAVERSGGRAHPGNLLQLTVAVRRPASPRVDRSARAYRWHIDLVDHRQDRCGPQSTTEQLSNARSPVGPERVTAAGLRVRAGSRCVPLPIATCPGWATIWT